MKPKISISNNSFYFQKIIDPLNLFIQYRTNKNKLKNVFKELTHLSDSFMNSETLLKVAICYYNEVWIEED
jgi:hypothetical protein